MTLNINDYVSVRLTEHGRRLHRENHERMRALVPADVPFSYTPPEEDADGWSRWQLWVLMQEFGAHMGNGCELAFETTIRAQPQEGR